MKRNGKSLSLGVLVALMVILLNTIPSTVLAGMITTESTINQSIIYSKSDWSRVLKTDEARQQLLSMGVDPSSVERRLNRLTDAELMSLSQQLQNAPVGEGAAGVILTVFVVFIITDMLCATDLFSFVKCINK